MSFPSGSFWPPARCYVATLLGTNISHRWKRKIIFPATWEKGMVYVSSPDGNWCRGWPTKSTKHRVHFWKMTQLNQAKSVFATSWSFKILNHPNWAPQHPTKPPHQKISTNPTIWAQGKCSINCFHVVSTLTRANSPHWRGISLLSTHYQPRVDRKMCEVTDPSIGLHCCATGLRFAVLAVKRELWLKDMARFCLGIPLSLWWIF